MAISQVGSAVASTYSSTQSPVMTLPSGLAADDVLVYAVASSTSHATTAPTNHTKIGHADSGGADFGMSVFHYTVTGSEGSSITLTNILDSSESGFVVCAAWRGVDTSAIVDASAIQGFSASTSVTAPSITPSVDDCMILMITGADPSSSHVQLATPDASPVATEIYDSEDGNNLAYCHYQYYQQSTAAAIQLNATLDFSDNHVCCQVALTTGAGGGPTPRFPHLSLLGVG